MTDFFNLLFTFPLIYAITNPPGHCFGGFVLQGMTFFDPVIRI